MCDSRSGLPDSIAASTIFNVPCSCSNCWCSGRGRASSVDLRRAGCGWSTISMSASTRSSSNERRSAAGSAAVEGGHDEHQAARLADHRQPGGVALVRAAHARRIDQFDRRQRDLLRMVDLAELLDARVGDRRPWRSGRCGPAPDRAPRRSASGTTCSCPTPDSRPIRFSWRCPHDLSRTFPIADNSSSACSTAWAWRLSRGWPAETDAVEGLGHDARQGRPAAARRSWRPVARPAAAANSRWVSPAARTMPCRASRVSNRR